MRRRSIGSLLGDDVFISYRRSEAADYTLALANELTRQELSCFVDQWGTPPGKELPASLKVALRKCSLLVVVGTAGAMTSDNVRAEVEEFAKTGRPIIPIVFPGEDESDQVSLERASWYPSVRGIAVTVETATALASAQPSPSVVSRVVNAEGYTRRNLRLRRIALALLVSILTLLMAAAVAGKKLWDEAEKAGASLRDMERQTDSVRRELAQAQQGLAAAEAATEDARAEAEAAGVRQQQAEARTREAAEQQKTAEREARWARAERLVTAAEVAVTEHPQRAMALAFAAVQTLREAGDVRNPAAEKALRHALVGLGGRILPHETDVRLFAFSSDAQWLAIGTMEGWIRVWRLTANGPVANPILLRGGWNVQQLSLSADGRWLYGFSRDMTDFVSLWDLRSAPPREFSLESPLFSKVENVQVTPDNRHVVIVGRLYGDPTIVSWDLPVSGPLTAPRLIYNESSFGLEKPRPKSFAFDEESAFLSMDARWLEVYKSLKGDVVLLDLTSADPRAKPIPLPEFSSRYQDFIVSNDRRWLFAVSSSPFADRRTTANLWDLQNPVAGPQSLAGDDPLASFTFSPDSHWLAMVYSNGRAKLWNLEAFRSGEGDAAITLSESGVKHLVFSGDSRLLATAGLDADGKPAGMVRLWNLQAVHPEAQPQILTGHYGEIQRLELSSDGAWLAATGPPVTSLWRLKGSAAEAPHAPIRLQGNERDVEAMAAFSPDGRWFVTAARYESAARLWDLAARQWSAAPRQLAGAENLRGQMVTKDRRWLLAKDPADRLLLWSIENWTAPPKVLGHYPDLWPRDGATAVSRDGHRLVVAHEDSLFLWDLRSGEMKPHVLTGNLGPITDAGFSSADSVFAHDQYGSWRWDLTTDLPYEAEYLGKMEGHRITFRLIEPTDEEPPPPIELPEPETDSRNFERLSPDEQWTIVVNSDGVHLFPNQLEDLMEAAREAGVRNLTSEEWEEFFPSLPYRKTVSAAQLTP